jgi:hypothetical protein
MGCSKSSAALDYTLFSLTKGGRRQKVLLRSEHPFKGKEYPMGQHKYPPAPHIRQMHNLY